ncbi:hypothetical protein MMC08_000489 [Hypocenomyce scalaris]|nr:hypothetical protein [Hypocenomyce scalaris]
MPPALQLSHNSDSEDEKVMTRQPQAQVRQPPEAGGQLFVVEDDSEGYGEEDENDDDNKDGEFVMKPTLATQTAVNRPLDQLNDLLKGPYLDLAPQYQRDVVWPSQLTLYHRLAAEVTDEYFCVETDDNGRPLERTAKRKILPKVMRDNFSRKSLLCCEYKDLSETQEREIFQRVQLGIPLTKAEAFRATMGVWQDFAELYEHDFPKVVNLVNNKRASGFRNILICFSQIYECHDPTAADGVPRLQHTIPSLEKFSKNQGSLSTKTKSHLREVFTLFNELVEEDATTFGDRGYTRVKTFAPIELVAVAVMLSQYKKRPKGMLRGDIATLRAHLRSKHEDLRMNGNCWASAWEYIDHLERYRGAVDTSTIRKQGGKTTKRATRNSGASEILSAPTLEPRPSAVTPRRSVAENLVQALIERTQVSNANAPNNSPQTQMCGQRQGQNTPQPQLDGPSTALVSRPPVSREAQHGQEPTPKVEKEVAEREALLSDIRPEPLRAASAVSSSSSSNPILNNARTPTAVMTTMPLVGKRRADLDLGSSSSAAKSLAAKKARLMGTLK